MQSKRSSNACLARSSPILEYPFSLYSPLFLPDEVDSLLGARGHQEHEATTAIKTEFMQVGSVCIRLLLATGENRGLFLCLPLLPARYPWLCVPACLPAFASHPLTLSRLAPTSVLFVFLLSFSAVGGF
jgi:hypothetical protein